MSMNMNTNARIIVSTIILLLLMSCNTNNNRFLRLERIEENNTVEFDTIEKCFNDSFYIINVIEKGYLGNFSINCGVIIKTNNKHIVYKILDINEFRVSTNYISKIDERYFGQSNWGWFYLDENRKLLPLPYENQLLDSLKSKFKDPNFFVNCNNTGEFYIYKNGKIDSVINYGNLIFKNQKIDYYKLENVILFEENGELKLIYGKSELNQLKKGLYFIAKPGLSTLISFSKKKLFMFINSKSFIKNFPDEIIIPIDSLQCTN